MDLNRLLLILIPLELVDRFVWHMQNVAGVNSVMGASEISKLVAAGYNEGNLKWATISRNQRLLGTTFNQMPNSLMNSSCSLLPVALFLDDHKAETLQAVVDAAQAFARDHRQEGIHFALAAGNAGIEAATNQEIGGAQTRMMLRGQVFHRWRTRFAPFPWMRLKKPSPATPACPWAWLMWRPSYGLLF